MCLQENSTTLLSAETIVSRFEIGHTTLYKWVADGQLPAIRFSKRLVRYRLSDLEKLIAANQGGDQP